MGKAGIKGKDDIVRGHHKVRSKTAANMSCSMDEHMEGERRGWGVKVDMTNVTLAVDCFIDFIAFFL